MKLTKAEKREKLRNNRSKMIVSNRSIFTLVKIKKDKYEQTQSKKKEVSRSRNVSRIQKTKTYFKSKKLLKQKHYQD